MTKKNKVSPTYWGNRFTAQVWRFFQRTFKLNPNESTKQEMSKLLKAKAANPDAFKKMRRDDKAMLSRLVKDGKTTKLWRGKLWSQMKENTRGQVVRSSKGKPFLRNKWTAKEKNVVRRNVSNPRVAYAALAEQDSPHNLQAVRRMAYRLRKEA